MYTDRLLANNIARNPVRISCHVIKDNTITVIHGAGSKTFYLFGLSGCSSV